MSLYEVYGGFGATMRFQHLRNVEDLSKSPSQYREVLYMTKAVLYISFVERRLVGGSRANLH